MPGGNENSPTRKGVHTSHPSVKLRQRGLCVTPGLCIHGSTRDCCVQDCGPEIEEKLVSLYDTNVTLTRLYATLHNRKFNGDNTRGEVRLCRVSVWRFAVYVYDLTICH